MTNHAGLDKAINPGRRERRETLIVGVFIACTALVFLNRSGIAILFPWIKPELGLSNVQLGQLMSITALSWGVSSLCFSLVSDALGIKPRTLVFVCILGFSVVAGLSSTVSSFPALLAFRAAMGVFEGPVIPLTQAMIIGASPPQRRGANIGAVIGGASFAGAVLAPTILGGLATTLGWRSALLAISFPGAVVAVAILLVTPSTPTVKDHPSSDQIRFLDALKLMANRNVAVGLIGAIALIGSAVASSTFLPLLIASLPGFSPKTVILLLIGLGAVSNIGGVVVAALSDRYGRRTCLIAACLCSSLAPLATAALTQSTWWLLAVLPLSLSGAGGFALMIYVIPGESVPARITATTFAVLLFVGELVGGATAPVMAGWIADHHGLAAAQLVPALLGGVATIAAFFVRDTTIKTSSEAIDRPEGG